MNVFKISRVLLLSSLVAAPCTMRPVNWVAVFGGSTRILTYAVFNELFYNPKPEESGLPNPGAITGAIVSVDIFLTSLRGVEHFAGAGLSVLVLSLIAYKAKNHKSVGIKTFGERLYSFSNGAARCMAFGSPLLFVRDTPPVFTTKKKFEDLGFDFINKGKKAVRVGSVEKMVGDYLYKRTIFDSITLTPTS
ncbi:hypothetical protein HOF51_02465 [bacterium]|jgi:hypothetical protein|nr:hypothetical protein [bacterium]MBT6130827.1 hypothetical protein [bacterium]